jgi:hypothetical protein
MSKDIVIGLQISMDSNHYNNTKEPIPWLDIPSLRLADVANLLQQKYGSTSKILIADDYLDVAAIYTAGKSPFSNAIIAGLAHTLLENLHMAVDDNLIPASGDWNLHIELKPRHRAPPPGVLLFAISAASRKDLKLFSYVMHEDFKSHGDFFSKNSSSRDAVLPDDIHSQIERTLGMRIINECRIFKIVDPYEDSKAMRELDRIL